MMFWKLAIRWYSMSITHIKHRNEPPEVAIEILSLKIHWWVKWTLLLFLLSWFWSKIYAAFSRALMLINHFRITLPNLWVFALYHVQCTGRMVTLVCRVDDSVSFFLVSWSSSKTNHTLAQIHACLSPSWAAQHHSSKRWSFVCLLISCYAICSTSE